MQAGPYGRSRFNIDEEMEGYWGSRMGSSILDFILVAVISFALAAVWLGVAMDVEWFIMFLVVMAVIGFLYFAVLEAGMSTTFGKYIVGHMEVVQIETLEPITGGQAFYRSLAKLNPVLAAAEYGMGAVPDADPRQLKLDFSSNTVVRRIPPQVMPRRPVMPTAPKVEPTGHKTYFGIPEELLNGQCPRCGSPYRVLPPDDSTTFSGLWNSRCTWCDTKVFEYYASMGRIPPPQWSKF